MSGELTTTSAYADDGVSREPARSFKHLPGSARPGPTLSRKYSEVSLVTTIGSENPMFLRLEDSGAFHAQMVLFNHPPGSVLDPARRVILTARCAAPCPRTGRVVAHGRVLPPEAPFLRAFPRSLSRALHQATPLRTQALPGQTTPGVRRQNWQILCSRSCFFRIH